MRSVRWAWVLAVASVIGCGGEVPVPEEEVALAASEEACRDGAPVVATRAGVLRGKRAGAVDQFLGVPYAEPPVGELRFRNPIPKARWRGVYDASFARETCTQRASADSPALVLNEDCLYLNLYRPAQPRRPGRLPVLFHIHGGGFTAGRAVNHDGSRIAETNDMVVVMVEYRLGALGFLALPELAAESAAAGGRASSGNYGVLDQQQALRWVQENVAAFGGDPDNVTISGQSAGGWSVCDHLTSPSSRGLFDRAIIVSGACAANPAAAAEAAGVTWAGALGCADPATRLTCLRGKTTAEVHGAAFAAAQVNYGEDNWLLAEHPATAVAEGRLARVPVMTGSTRDEIGFVGLFRGGFGVVDQATFEAYVDATFPARAADLKAAYRVADYPSPAYAVMALWTDDSGWFSGIGGCDQRRLTRTLARHVPTYWYEFNDRTMPTQLNLSTGLPNLTLGLPIAYHTGDLRYSVGFDTVAPLNEAQEVLAGEVVRYWGAFARWGVPFVRGQAFWPSYRWSPSFASMELPGTVLRTDAEYAAEHHCEVWDP